MIKSMTAFSRAEKIYEKMTLSVEIRSYNSRYLDLIVRMPQSYNGLEERVKSLISEKISRGRIEVRLQIKDESEESYSFDIDEPKAKAYHQALMRLREMFAIDSPVTLEMLNNVNGVIKPTELDKDEEKIWNPIQESLTEAVEGLNAMKNAEGDFIARDMLGRLDYIEECTNKIESESDGLIRLYHERLRDRITSLTNGMVEIDPDRIAQEAAFLADRSDISEEILRAKSHIAQFRTIMASPEPGGRKLNFLLQEFNREFNTIGSKTGKSDISHIVVDLKSELEKMREQIQNIE